MRTAERLDTRSPECLLCVGPSNLLITLAVTVDGQRSRRAPCLPSVLQEQLCAVPGSTSDPTHKCRASGVIQSSSGGFAGRHMTILSSNLPLKARDGVQGLGSRLASSRVPFLSLKFLTRNLFLPCSSKNARLNAPFAGFAAKYSQLDKPLRQIPRQL